MREFAAGMSGEKGRDLSYLKRFWPYVKPQRLALFLGLIIVPLITLVHLAQPILIQRGIDDYILKGDLSGLSGVAGLFGLCVMLELIFRSSQSYIFQLVGVKSVTKLRDDLFGHILGQSSSYYDKTPTGKLVTRVTSDIEALNETFSSGVVTLIADILTVLGILGCMLWLSPKLTLITLLAVPPLFIIVNHFKKKLRAYYGEIRTTVARLNAYLQEQLEGYQIVQLFQREKRNYAGFQAENQAYKKANLGSIRNDALLYSSMEGVTSVVIVVMIYAGAVELGQGTITLGLLVAFIEYIRKFFQPLKELAGKFAILQAALAALEKIFSSFDIQTEIASGSKTLSKQEISLSFKNVSFSYPGHEDKPVLKDVSFTIEPGQTVAIVGPTGSGKSTISKLVSHLYPGYSGEIVLNQTELKDLDLNSLRHSVGFVNQDVQLFSDTVQFNIGLGNPEITSDEIVEAAKLAQADKFIQTLPSGYKTKLSSSSEGLSAGQAQLISIARAIAIKSPFLVMDEATASVDSLVERDLQTAISNLLKTKTVLVIAHRLSTIKKADKILALKAGEIIESGTHEELLEKNGYYSKLYRVQFAEEA